MGPEVLLVNPPMSKGWRPYMIPPIGLGYLNACLKREGIDSKIVDTGGYKLSQVRDLVYESKPRILGITVFTECRHNALSVAGFGIENGCRTVLGGVHSTARAEEISNNYSTVRHIFKGECEEVFPEAIVKGLDKRVYEGTQIANLDSLPLPDYGDLDLNKYMDVEGPTRGKKLMAVITSRGCAFNCIYCSSHSMWGNWRTRSIGSILNEFEYWYNEGYRTFSIVDDIFSLNRKRLIGICEGIINREISDIEWRAQTRVDCIDKELLKLMMMGGCVMLAFGVESGSPSVLKELNKKEEIEDVVQAFEWCRELGIKTTFNVIVGSPGETKETTAQTRELIKRCKPDYIGTAALRVYPGTQLWERWVSEGGNEDYWLGDNECLYYENSMKLDESYKEIRKALITHAQTKGIKGYMDLAKFGVNALRETPSKVLRGLR